MLLPALAAAKSKAQRIQCVSQLKQLGIGISLFATDRNEMFPPAGYGTPSGQLAWDTYINRYIGGKLPTSPSSSECWMSRFRPRLWPVVQFETEALGSATPPGSASGPMR